MVHCAIRHAFSRDGRNELHPKYQARSRIGDCNAIEITIRLSANRCVIQPKQQPCLVSLVFIGIDRD